MDNHPIPQDVTNFQFKLVGDLTLKQFGYLVAAVIITWLIMLLPIFFIVKFPFALCSLGLGVILAFVPFEGRPSDLMLLHFLKALITPNQYSYQAGSITQAHVNNQTPLIKQPQQEEKKDEKIFVQSLPIAMPITKPQEEQHGPAFVNPSQAPHEASQQITPQPAQQPSPTQITQTVAAEEKTLEDALTKAKAEEANAQAGTVQAAAAHEKVQQLEAELHEVFLQKQDLEKQILELKQQLVAKKQEPVFTPGTIEAPQQTTHVLKVPKQLGKSVGLPIIPDTPNLLTGIVKDPRGNVLSNILVEVKDKDGNAVRAFKTNALGQFASATPLVNGTYAVSFEDATGKNSFDSVEINATGEIMLPIEVISVDQRELLRQQLFGAGSTNATT